MGWGRSEDKYRRHEEVPREVKIKSVNDSICFSGDPKIGALKSGRMFCGTGEGQGPCRGDSGKYCSVLFSQINDIDYFFAGGGFLIRFRGKWVLKGLVSSGSSNHETCNVDLFTLYTETDFFTDWIKSSVRKNSDNPNLVTTKNIIVKKNEISAKYVKSYAVHDSQFYCFVCLLFLVIFNFLYYPIFEL